MQMFKILLLQLKFNFMYNESIPFSHLFFLPRDNLDGWTMPAGLVGSTTIHARQSILVRVVIVTPARDLEAAFIAYKNQHATIPASCRPVNGGCLSIVVIIVGLVAD